MFFFQFFDGDFVLKPTNRGANLSLRRYATLMWYSAKFCHALRQNEHMVAHLGGRYITSAGQENSIISIKKLDNVVTEPLPSKSGEIKLTAQEFFILLDSEALIKKAVPELEATLPCFLTPDHVAKEGMFGCTECRPPTFFEEKANLKKM